MVIQNFRFSERKTVKIVLILLLILYSDWIYCQSQEFSYYYRVYFRDKGENTINNFSAADLISSRALERRHKAGIQVPDITDIPVFEAYIDTITSKGYTLHCKSKWMNTALFKTHTPLDINIIRNLSFVSDVRIVRTPGIKSPFNDKLVTVNKQAGDPPFDRPVTMVNGYALQNAGYDGKGILIAIIDAGFIDADKINSLTDLRNRNGIKATFNFVKNYENVYESSSHGTEVFSVLGGKITGSIAGTAPGADYLLLKTEDVNSEFPCEEDFWAAGAEFADSSGADIISSSLGYFNFDDPSMNYKHADLDGNTAFVTRTADIAASKGILVVNSAGNERNGAWVKIICPSDGDSVIAVGAVDGGGLISTFSSSGPSADKRIKPDNVTMGVSVPVQLTQGEVTRGNGTSFACPVMSGMAACLMQAIPQALNSDIIEALHKSADRYNFPDSLYGYGIPDMAAALDYLTEKYFEIPADKTIAAPNPTTGTVKIAFHDPPGSVTIEIISLSGRILYRTEYPDFAGRILTVTELQNMEQGIYFIKVSTGNWFSVHKIIKISN